MRALLERAPTLALAADPVRKPNFVIRGLEGLGVEVG
jgi:unspecific monooxygenase